MNTKTCPICGAPLPPRQKHESAKRYAARTTHAGACRTAYLKERKRGLYAGRTPALHKL